MLNEGKRKIYLDLMVYVKDVDTMPDPPFGSLDFACNALILDKYGYRLSLYIKIADPVHRLKKMLEIMKDIEAKKTEVVNVKWYRMRKMLRKGWSISGVMQHIEQVREDDYSGYCLICHGSLNELDPTVFDIVPHMKLKCCDARYHPSCLSQAINDGDNSIAVRGKCPMCSKVLDHVRADGQTLAEYIDNRIHLMI
jgi:hypothetical protein